MDHYAKMSVSDTVVLVWEGKGRPPNLTMTASIDVQSVKVVVANSQSTKYMLPPATLGTHECMLHVEGWKPMEELMLDGLHEVKVPTRQCKINMKTCNCCCCVLQRALAFYASPLNCPLYVLHRYGGKKTSLKC